MCLVFLAILTIGNLRGIRESGKIFAVPTYFFVVSIALLLAAGAVSLPHRRHRAGRRAAAAERRTRSR